jgi:hypothetical protein
MLIKLKDFLALNIDLLSSIFTQWLDLKNTCKFDSAICNKKQRELFLNCLKLLVFEGYEENKKTGQCYLKYLKLRNISVKTIKCTYDSRFTLDSLTNVLNNSKKLQIININEYSCNLKNDKSIINDFICDKISKCSNELKIVNLSRCTLISDIGAIKLAENLKGLKVLNLSYNSKITDVSIIKITQFQTNLQSLELANLHHLTDNGIVKIAENLICLNILKLSKNHITDISVIKIAENLINLELLMLQGCVNITDKGVIRIAEKLLKLHDLDISFNNNITDNCIVKVTSNLIKLEILNLNSTSITDNGLNMIGNHLFHLKELDIRRCEKIGCFSIINLVEKCNHLEKILLNDNQPLGDYLIEKKLLCIRPGLLFYNYVS